MFRSGFLPNSLGILFPFFSRGINKTLCCNATIRAQDSTLLETHFAARRHHWKKQRRFGNAPRDYRLAGPNTEFLTVDGSDSLKTWGRRYERFDDYGRDVVTSHRYTMGFAVQSFDF